MILKIVNVCHRSTFVEVQRGGSLFSLMIAFSELTPFPSLCACLHIAVSVFQILNCLFFCLIKIFFFILLTDFCYFFLRICLIAMRPAKPLKKCWLFKTSSSPPKRRRRKRKQIGKWICRLPTQVHRKMMKKKVEQDYSFCENFC